jgi:hypothetical protein
MRKWSKKVPLFLKPPGLQPGVVKDAEVVEESTTFFLKPPGLHPGVVVDAGDVAFLLIVAEDVAFLAIDAELVAVSINPHRHR